MTQLHRIIGVRRSVRTSVSSRYRRATAGNSELLPTVSSHGLAKPNVRPSQADCRNQG